MLPSEPVCLSLIAVHLNYAKLLRLEVPTTLDESHKDC